jgi:deoxyribonuclease V
MEESDHPHRLLSQLPSAPAGDLPRIEPLHAWDVTVAEAQAIQRRLRAAVRLEPLDLSCLRTVAGADLSFDRGADTVFAGFVVLALPGLEVVDRAGVRTTATFPYVPGLLSFREAPPLLEAWQQLRVRPDALICDGQGLAHPRRFGLACHVGLLLDLPCAGCAKRILVGTHAPVGEAPGERTPLRDRGETVGAALRLRAGVTPVYVSPGHRCDLESAVELVRRCAGATRVPETTRQAHLFVNQLRRGEVEPAQREKPSAALPRIHID